MFERLYFDARLFQIYAKKEKTCTCHSFWIYSYCKHSIAIEAHLNQEVLSNITNMNEIGSKQKRGRPKLNGPGLMIE